MNNATLQSTRSNIIINTYTSCYRLAVNEICQCYHFQKQKIAKNSKFIENGHTIYIIDSKFYVEQFFIKVFSFPSNHETLNVDQVLVRLFLEEN